MNTTRIPSARREMAPPVGRPGRLAALDLLRFLAAFSVGVFHLVAVAGTGEVQIWGSPPEEIFGPLHLVASWGWVGVPLFFMISGFVICKSAWGRGPAEYLTSRFVRLFPALWVCMVITTLVTTAHPDVFEPVPFRAFLVNLFLLEDPLGVPRVDDVYWTLWLELKFYLLFLVVVAVGVTYRNTVAFCFAWTAASVVAAELRQPWLDALVMRENSQYFVAGIAFCLIHRFGPRLELWILVVISWILSMHYYTGNPWQSIHGTSYTPTSVLVTVCFVLLALLSLRKFDWMRWRRLEILGSATYPFYLLHYAAGFAVVHLVRERSSIGPFTLLVLALAVLTGVSILVNRLAEQPIARRLRTAGQMGPPR